MNANFLPKPERQELRQAEKDVERGESEDWKRCAEVLHQQLEWLECEMSFQ